LSAIAGAVILVTDSVVRTNRAWWRTTLATVIRAEDKATACGVAPARIQSRDGPQAVSKLRNDGDGHGKIPGATKSKGAEHS
jgi:hypothetical protein